MSHVQNETRKIVKPKDITKEIARMMVLDLRPFDIVEDVGFNELFILATNPFSNPNSFENVDKFENLEIFWYQSRSRRNFVFLHTSKSRTFVLFDLTSMKDEIRQERYFLNRFHGIEVKIIIKLK